MKSFKKLKMRPEKTALLVIDMQNDFVRDGGLLEVNGIRKHINEFKGFIDKCRDAGMLIIYTRHCYAPKKNPIEARLFHKLKNKGLRRNTEGWEIYNAMKPHKEDIIIDKSRYDAFFNTELHNILRAREIDAVIITGTMTDICCESTARTAMSYDYKVIFCSDFTYTNSHERYEGTLKVIRSHFGDVVSSGEIIKRCSEQTERF